MNNWIDFDKQKPVPGQRGLVCSSGKSCVAWVEFKQREGEITHSFGGYLVGASFGDIYPITHWAPIPDPPKAAPKKGDWVSPKESLPEYGERVLVCYVGVYEARVVTFWRDQGGSPHFGGSKDEYGSQPITHWMPLPENP